jgi:anaerobic selenocysteine-containing dehydrogenase
LADFLAAHPVAQRIIEGKMKGAKLAVIDPRLSNTASMADYWMPSYPGTEAAVLLAIAKILLEEGMYNRDYMENWVNWDEYLAAKHPDQLETRTRAFVCPDTCCGFESLTKAGLRSHYLLKHLTAHTNKYLGKTDTGIQCTHCGTDFQSKPSYVYHLAQCLPSEVTSDAMVKKGLCI